MAADLLVSPLVAISMLSRRSDRAYQGLSQFLSLFPGTAGDFIRRSFYRWTLKKCARSCTISFGTLFATRKAEVGENVYIGARCMIGWAIIGNDVLIGSNVDILSGKHQHRFRRSDIPIRLQGGTYSSVTIGQDAWIGNGALVSADIGAHAIVAAGAVVVKPVREGRIVGGNPAREIGTRPDWERGPTAQNDE